MRERADMFEASIQSDTHQTATLENGTKVHAIGSMPMKQRALSKWLHTGAKTVGCLFLGGLLAAGALATPVGQNYMDNMAQSRTQIKATSQQIAWVNMPTTSLIEAGTTEYGDYDPMLLMERWHAAGIPKEDFKDLLMMGRDTSPMIMGTADPSMQALQMARAQGVIDEIEARWPEAVSKLSDPQWLKDHYYVEADEATQEVIFEIVQNMMEELEMDEVTEPDDYIEVRDMAHARLLMEDAMAQTGLRSLRIEALMARDPWTMGNAAYKLIQTNNQLRARTGWEGGVLGLGGRVDWVLGMPGDGIDGVTKSSLLDKKDQSMLTVVSGFGSAPHEFYHAFSIVAGRKSMVSALGLTIEGQLDALRQTYYTYNDEKIEVKELRARNYEGMIHAVVDANEAIRAQSPDWISIRNETQQKLDTPDGYWLRSEEILASAFTAQIRKWDRNSVHEPSMDDADKHAPYFDAIFSVGKDMNLTQRIQMSRLDVARWNLGQLINPSITITAAQLDAPPAIEAANRRSVTP